MRACKVFLLSCAALLPVFSAWAQPEQAGEADKTLSPYFFVKSDDPAVDQLPLKSTGVETHIAGVIADVAVTQVYKNDGKRPLEAEYIFPASTRAAVYAMKMTIGPRTIVAQIKRRDEARADYEQARQEGRSASLLEQQRPNVFQMSVANIMPGDEIKVEMKYTELLIPTDGVYEFMYPTVVGPRYTNKPQAGAPDTQKWVKNPYLHEGEAAPSTLSISATLASGVPLQDANCDTHKVNISYDSPTSAKIVLADTEKFGGNRDFILKYRLSGSAIESGVLLYKGGKDQENFFLAMLQPPQRVKSAQIPQREYLFIVDVSGSMHGFPLEISKGLIKDLLGNLRPNDMFNILLFAGGSQVLAESSLSAIPENIRKAVDFIDRQSGGGGTELLPALKRALALPHAEGCARTVVIATDGYVDVEPEAFELVRSSLNQASLFPFGIGSSVNRLLIEGLAHAGQGEPFILTKPDEAARQAAKFREYIQSPVLTGVKAAFQDFDAYDVEPLSIPDVFAERPVLIYGKWRGEARGEIKLSGRAAGEAYNAALKLADAKALPENSALRYLWARERIRMLSDFNNLKPDSERVKEITSLALRYSLLSNYTSFVAVDSEVRRKDGDLASVKQPLPLPQGVSDLAVGGVSANAPMMRSKVMPEAVSQAGAPPSKSEGGFFNLLGRKTKSQAAAPTAMTVDEQRHEMPEKELKPVRTIVAGGWDSAVIASVIQSQSAALNLCVPKSVNGKELKLVLSFQLDAAGRIANVSLEGPIDESTKKCLTAEVLSWTLSAPQSAGAAFVKYELNFNAAGLLKVHLIEMLLPSQK